MSGAHRSDGQGRPEFINAILQNLAEAVVACDTNGILTHFNQTARDLHGVGESPIPPTEWAAHYSLFKSDGVTPLPTGEIPLFRALSGESVRDVEIVIRNSRGTRNVICSGHAIFDRDGKKLGAVVAMRDITDSKKANAEHLRALADSEKRFRTLFEQSPLSVQLLSVDGRTLQVNEAWKKLWGVDDAFVNEIILTRYRILEDPQLVEKGIMPYLQSAFAGKGTKIPAIKYEPSETAPIGRARWVEGYAEPIFDESGHVREVVLIHQDVTAVVNSEMDLKMAKDAAEEANRLKSSFLANMSHEIRTPLSAVLGFSQLLKDRTLSPEDSEEYSQIIERNGRALMQIIDDILDLSKIEAGRLKLEVVQMDLNELLNEISAMFKVHMTGRDVRLISETLPDSQRFLQTDPARLRQVLINLVGNAVKFTSRGEIRVTAEVRAKTLTISVKDSGVGIDPQLQSQLFKPFNQIDNSWTRKFGGTGLGLALSKRLAQALAGDVTLTESKPNVGSTFVVTLPYEPAKLSEATGESKEAKPSSREKVSVIQDLEILLVDDSEDNRRFVAHILSKRGALITQARDGREAITTASSKKFDVILMDVQMPVLDGNEATRSLRASGNTTPIIALTAHAMPEEKERCLLAGANAHVTKPVDVETLVATILRLL